MRSALVPSRLRLRDVFRVGGAGLRTRPGRVLLSALGIIIGIAAMLSVVGISASSRGDLNRRLAALGTNLLTVGPGQDFFGEEAHLPTEAVAMIGEIGPVTSVSATGQIDTHAYPNDRVPATESGGIAVLATRLDLPGTVGADLASGTWLNGATAGYPAVVLGATAADRLGVTLAGPGVQVYVGDRWFTVVGVLAQVPLAPELDLAVLVGWPVAERELGFDGFATTVYTRSREEAVPDVRAVLAATANPEDPSAVDVSRPSDALVAQQTADETFEGLLVGLGAVALLVGGLGIANTMIMSVLERRAEIGLRRALGATRGHIRVQFLVESLLLSVIGGTGGVLVGIAVTAAYAWSRSWPVVVPAWATLGAYGATLVVGALAGLYPALRAARLAPTEALATP
jgi:putative ABC transport system permease protein